MNRKCLKCGVEFIGRPDSTLCPDCVKKAKSSTRRPRACTVCGGEFIGGPSALYCPTCRAEIIRARDRAYHRNGPRRPLGSTDHCEWCGKPYIVTAPTQRYCSPECSELAVKEKDREKALEWYAAHRDPAAKKERIKASSADRFCVVCGNRIDKNWSSQTCSPQCAAIHHQKSVANWEKNHRTERNEYHRNLYHKKRMIENMKKHLPDLWVEALHEADRDRFVSEWSTSIIWGPPEELSDSRFEEIINYTGRIWDAAHMTMKDLIQLSQLSQSKFAHEFGIPQRTVESWCMGDRTPPDYVRFLFCRILVFHFNN